jgi:DNA-binding PucR family transcriptional regulator
MAELAAIAIECPGVGVPALRAACERALPPDGRVARSRRGMVVALFPVPGRAALRAAAEAIRSGVALALDDPRCTAGVGAPREGVIGAHVAMLQAEQALHVGRGLRGTGPTTLLEDLGPYCFVLGQPTREIREFCERTLGPLLENEELVRTLEAYLRSHGSLNEVGRRLFLHRNTVRLRLRRIAALTGADLADPDARLALHLAILGRSALARLAS